MAPWPSGRQPAATNLSMFDGFVTAIVAGPVSFDPRERICPLLAIDADALDPGGTPEFAAISPVAVRSEPRRLRARGARYLRWLVVR
jgi:hypothetical protein